MIIHLYVMQNSSLIPLLQNSVSLKENVSVTVGHGNFKKQLGTDISIDRARTLG